VDLTYSQNFRRFFFKNIRFLNKKYTMFQTYCRNIFYPRLPLAAILWRPTPTTDNTIWPPMAMATDQTMWHTIGLTAIADGG
jgi:hypothetical protein